MAFKFIALAGLVAMANAGLLPSGPSHFAPVEYSAPAVYAQPAYQQSHAAPAAKSEVTEHEDYYDHNPQYTYSYEVHDHLSGDVKSQQETRNGDVVEGSYSLIEADGSRRIVHYTADHHNGFNAIVEKEPAKESVKAAPAKTVAYAAPTYSHAAPVTHKSAPVSYAAPTYSHSAPVYHY